MNILTAFLLLRGNKFEDNILVLREKVRHLFFRSFTLFTKKNYFTMGEGLNRSVIATNSYGKFLCRKKSADLHIISDSYEFRVRELFEKLAKKSSLILDVGANVGKYSVLACKANPSARVFSFEPQEDNFKALEKNKQINHCKNLELVRMAISNKREKIKLYSWRGTGSFSIKFKSRKFKEVESDKLDNLFRGDRIDLMKVDTEGAELDVLLGASEILASRRIIYLIIELDETNEKRIKEFMRDLGYGVRKIQYNNFLFSLK